MLPASATGAGLIVRIMMSDAAGQAPAGSSLVMVSVTVPAVMSAAEGVYVVPPNVPLPLVLQLKVLAVPPTDPSVVYVSPAQIAASDPAAAVAGASITIVAVAVIAGHPPDAAIVFVTVYVP